jgi:hypothetical protein
LNAGHILRRAGLDTEELRRELLPVDPDTVNVWPASKWLRKLWRPGIRGVTQWRLVFVDPGLLRGDGTRLARTVVHELVHVRQFVEQGYLAFMARYIGDYLRARLEGLAHREAYLNNPAEMEAREVTARHL